MKYLVLAALLLAGGAPASAATIVNVNFAGTFTNKLLSRLVPNGTGFSGSFSYDADTAPTASNAFGAVYNLNLPASVTIGNTNYSGTLSSTIIRSIIDGTIFRIQLPGSQTFALTYASLGSGSGIFALPNTASAFGPTALATLRTNPLTGNFGAANVTASVAAVPEPATWAMLIAGFGLIGAFIRRGRRQERLARAFG